MLHFEYPVRLERDEDGAMLVFCDDLPDFNTFGDDEADALDHARDALLCVLSGRIDLEKDIPPPSPVAGRPVVRLPLLWRLKLIVRKAMRERGMTQADLAKAMGCDQKQVQRILDFRHASRVDQIEAALAALDRAVEIREAA